MEKEFYYLKDGTKVIFVAPIAELEEIIDHMDRFKYKYDHLLVIGNGFDLNLGLKTTYRNFVESCIFKKMYIKRIQEKREMGNSQPSLIDYLYGKKFCERWYDIEQALLEYVSKRPDGSYVNNVEEDKKDYELICSALIGYLANLFMTGNDLEREMMMEKSSAGQLLKRFCSERNNIYSFNYTPICLIINAVYSHASLEPIQLHGRIKEETIFNGNAKDNAIILGIETNDLNTVAPGYSFLLKSNNPAYRSSNIAIDLMNTKNVIFFGHSLNQMDFGYFKDYFEMLMSNTDKERTLTIITKDEVSRVALLDNLRSMGISVRDVFAHTKVEFILTALLSEDNKEEHERFNNLMTQIDRYY